MSFSSVNIPQHLVFIENFLKQPNHSLILYGPPSGKSLFLRAFINVFPHIKTEQLIISNVDPRGWLKDAKISEDPPSHWNSQLYPGEKGLVFVKKNVKTQSTEHEYLFIHFSTPLPTNTSVRAHDVEAYIRQQISAQHVEE